MERHKWKPQDLLDAFPLTLRGRALTFYYSLPSQQQQNFDDLKSAFMSEYFPEEKKWSLRLSLYELKMTDSLEDFIKELQNKCQLLQITDETKLDLLMKGITPTLRLLSPSPTTKNFC